MQGHRRPTIRYRMHTCPDDGCHIGAKKGDRGCRATCPDCGWADIYNDRPSAEHIGNRHAATCTGEQPGFATPRLYRETS